MKRFGQTILLKPGKEEEYIRYHSEVWPGVLRKIKECNISNYSIFNKENVLHSFEKSIHDLENVPVQFFPNYCMAWMYQNESYKCTSCCNFKYQNITC